MTRAGLLAALLAAGASQPSRGAELTPTLRALATVYGAGVSEPVAVQIDVPHMVPAIDGVTVVGAGRWSPELSVCVRWTRTTLLSPEPAITTPIVDGSLAEDLVRTRPAAAATTLQPSYGFARGKGACANAGSSSWFELTDVPPSRRVFKEAARRLGRLRSRRALGLAVSCANGYDCESWREIEADRHATPGVVSRSQAGWRFIFSRSDIPPSSVQYRARLSRSRVEVVRVVNPPMLVRLKAKRPT